MVSSEARAQATDSMIAESGSRVTSTVGHVEPDNSETRNKVEGGESQQKIEVHPCSSVEEQDDGEVDETKLTVPEEILPATPSTSSDEEGSISSLEIGMEEEMEPIK